MSRLEQGVLISYVEDRGDQGWYVDYKTLTGEPVGGGLVPKSVYQSPVVGDEVKMFEGANGIERVQLTGRRKIVQ